MWIPDWQIVEQRLFEKAKEAVEQFAREHPETMCSFFACAADPLSGEFAFCLDTPENATHEAIKHELVVQQHRQAVWKQAGHASAWRYARSYLNQSVIDYASHASLFHYAFFTTLSFNWIAFTDSKNYPAQEEGQDHYLEGQTMLVLWKAIERLVAENVFLHLHMTSPFRVGYQFPEESLVVLHLLNWSTARGSRLYSAFTSPPA